MTYTVSRIGQANQTGDVKDLFLKVFPGEVLTTFETNSVMKGKVFERTIASGKSAQFPVIGDAVAEYHTPGVELLGGKLHHNEVVITIDDKLISKAFVADFDEAMSHFEVRARYSHKLGYALAKTRDRQLLQLAVLAARAAARITGESGGSVITDADADTNMTSLHDSLVAAQTIFDEKDVPETERFVFLKPTVYNKLAATKEAIEKDVDGSGSFSKGKIFELAGFQLVKTNNLPSTNVTTGTLLAGTDDKYLGDFSTTVAVALHLDALGTVKLMDLAMEKEYTVRSQGTLMVAKLAEGSGVLNPACAIEIKTA